MHHLLVARFVEPLLMLALNCVLVYTAQSKGVKLHNVRHGEQTFPTGKGHKRTGKRILTVGTDCSIGKKYTALALDRDMRAVGMKSDFCATGQTGIFISGRGVSIDARPYASILVRA